MAEEEGGRRREVGVGALRRASDGGNRTLPLAPQGLVPRRIVKCRTRRRPDAPATSGPPPRGSLFFPRARGITEDPRAPGTT